MDTMAGAKAVNWFAGHLPNNGSFGHNNGESLSLEHNAISPQLESFRDVNASNRRVIIAVYNHVPVFRIWKLQFDTIRQKELDVQENFATTIEE
ncbi:unnamed protein product [Ceratitis capitata]|uniref:(Mediterranean fruit fly) hypothetical protein n=1 Tax=Ceratitis capitata TaxID=7213 RepID=A0A811V8D4_CERCA|nr:unnamed protein product [Ceratitis capitata]